MVEKPQTQNSTQYIGWSGKKIVANVPKYRGKSWYLFLLAGVDNRIAPFRSDKADFNKKFMNC